MSTTQLYTLKTLEDQRDANSFLTLTKPRLKNVKNHTFTWWDPSRILPGEDREAEINKHLSAADYVILLLSPHLLAAMKDQELPSIDKVQAKLLPVMLVNVPLDDTMDCFGIDARQIYRGDQAEPHSYDSLDSAYQRNRFVDGFVSRMIRRIDNKGGYR